MNHLVKASVWVVILFCGTNQISLATGPVDPDEPGEIPCVDDGICHVNGCQATPDPDCPDIDLPNNGSDGGSNGSDGTPSSWDEEAIDTDLVRLVDRGIDLGDNSFVLGAPLGSGSVVWSIVGGFYTPRLIGTLHLDGVSGQYGRMHISYWGGGELIDTRHGGIVRALDNDHHSWSVDLSPLNLMQITEVHVCTEISSDGVIFSLVDCTTKYLGD
jgi:hypothetical protein